MSAWFRKKNKETIEKVPCLHIWKDFPWYISATYERNFESSLFGTLTVSIYEPYVCAACKKRRDIELVKMIREDVERSKIRQTTHDMIGNYLDKIKPRVIIEDMVNDFIYVDREKLAILEKLRGLSKE